MNIKGTTMYSTKYNQSNQKPEVNSRNICGSMLLSDCDINLRISEGGLRTAGFYKKSTEKLPLISIITVVYNNAETISRSIESVLNQDYQNVEYILVDGGSTDDTVEIIKKYEDAIDYYVSEPDTGIYNAMNKGLSLVTGDYIALLNSDDWYEPGLFSEIASKIRQNSRKIYVAPTRVLSETYKKIMVRGVLHFDERVYLRMPVSHPGSFIPAEIYNDIGKFDEKYHLVADWDFFIRAYRQGAEVEELERIYVNYWRAGATAVNGGDHLIFKEQVELLVSYFCDVKHYDLLYLLSSKMEEASYHEITETLKKFLNSGGKLPRELEIALDKYIDKRFGKKKKATFIQFRNKHNDRIDKVRPDKKIERLFAQVKKLNLDQKNIWLINERGWDACDNGFAFYEYIKQNHPEINAYYVITKDSKDYNRVAAYGDEWIIPYLSETHKIYYLASKYVISSQGGHHVHPFDFAYLKSNYGHTFHTEYIFLQHGILKDYIYYFHKGYFNHSLFIVSGEMERRLMLESHQMTHHDIAVTGLARYDKLNTKEEPYIFFMPTWRNSINNKSQLLNSEFYKNYNKLLNSEILQKLLEKYNLKLKFLLHPNFSKFDGLLKTNIPNVDIIPSGADIAELIKKCAYGLTDYSSVIFDIAYLNKPVAYFQFDYKNFRKTHYKKSHVFFL